MGKILRKDSKVFVDLVSVIGFAALCNWILYQLTTTYAGPITALATLALVSFIMHYRGIPWSSYGLRKPKGAFRLLGQVVLVFIGTVAAGVITQYMASLYLTQPAQPPSRFATIEGNLIMFLWWSAIGWAVGGFAEEMIFRGFLLNRFEALFTEGKWATVLAVILQALLFGLVHFYNRGAIGAITISVVAATLGLFYLCFGRNLWPLIIAHGLVDTLSFLEDYFGA